MDKYEYKVRSEEISKLIDKEKYAEAVKIADTIDWRRVKSVTMLLRIAALYRVSRRNDDSREMLLLAYDRYPTNRSVVHSLCELSIEMEDVVSAVEYYKQFVKLAPKDSGVYTLRYRILEAQEVSLEERIEVLEELKKKDYQEEWAYELAYLYHRIGLATKCVEECDDIILWFGDGPYVMKAMELKAMHVPLTNIQQKNYDIMLGNAAENYSSENYDYGSNDANDKIVNFNPRNNNVENETENYIENDIQDNYTAQDYGTDGYDENFSVQDFAGSGYENAAYGQEAYTENGYDQAAYAQNQNNQNGYSQTPYDSNGYAQTAYDQNSNNPNGYNQNPYGSNGYDQTAYAQNPTDSNGYAQTAYAQNLTDPNGYAQTAYDQNSNNPNGYSQTPYDPNGYGQTAYEQDPNNPNGYAQTAYAQNQNNQNGYSQTPYDPNGYDQTAYAQDGYRQDKYRDNSYDQKEYHTEPYAGNPGYDQTAYGGNDSFAQYPNNDYGQSGYGADSYAENAYTQGEYANSQYAGNSSYDQNAYSAEPYPDNQGYGQTAYNTEPYPDQGGSGQNGYGTEPYAYTDNQGYGQTQYGTAQYTENGYGQAEYTNEHYPDNSYPPNQYVDDGYGNLSYNDGTYQENSAYPDTPYQENGYTEAFYVEQIYDENGNLINPDSDAGASYPQPQGPPLSGQYRNGLHLVENKKAASGEPDDMSQYNTINLQKVVAESMRELFPDDDEDVFAEDREKYNSGEDIKSITERNTRVFANIADAQAQRGRRAVQPAAEQAPDEAEEPYNYFTQTGRIAQMVTGVSETAPEPHTGAIKKVYVPGDDARLIKTDADMNELRDITEKSVSDEQSWIESNEENVYHEQSIMEMNGTDSASKKRATGPMKIDEVLVEWERMKLDNAKKHQEEIKQHVLTQTGKIFVNFDNSIKSGILGELEREEEEARRSSQADKASRKERAARKQFLEADVTGDIPQRTASDDDFDVEYVTEHSARETAAPQTQERAPTSEKPARTVKSEAELREAYLDMLERVISRELGKEAEAQNEMAKDISAETDKTVQSNPSQNTAEAAAQTAYPLEAGGHAQDAPAETYTDVETDSADSLTEATAYVSEGYTEYGTGENESDQASENVSYETGEYEPDQASENVSYEIGEHESDQASESAAYDANRYEPDQASESAAYDANRYEPDQASEGVSYETGEYGLDQASEGVSYNTGRYELDETSEDASYNTGRYELDQTSESASYNTGRYELDQTPESASYDTDGYKSDQASEGTAYDTDGCEPECSFEDTLYESGKYEPERASDTGAYEAGEYAQNFDAPGVEYTGDVYAPETYTEGAAYEADTYTTEDAIENDSNLSQEDDQAAMYAPERYTENTAYDTDGYEPPDSAENAMYAPDGYAPENYGDNTEYTPEQYAPSGSAENEAYNASEYTQEIPASAAGYTSPDYTQQLYAGEAAYIENAPQDYTQKSYIEESAAYSEGYSGQKPYAEESAAYSEGYNEQKPYAESASNAHKKHSRRREDAELLRQQYQYNEKALDPEDAQSIAEMAMEDALKTQEIKMNTADLSSLSEKIVATTKKEAKGAKREELREFTPDEQTLFENFAVTKKIKKQIIHALENMTLTAYTGNVIITGDAGLDTVRMAKNLVKEYQASDESFSGKLAKITGEKINQRNIKDVFEKLNNGGIIIEKANGMSEEKLYEMAINLNQENLGIVVIMEDTKKEITKLLEKQAMIADYFNIRIDLMEMDNNALVAYAKNYALALEYSIDELGTLALYTRIANMQSGNHVVTKDEVRDIIDEAIWKSKKSKIKNFVDVLFARRYDNEDMIVLKERDFM